MASPIPQPFATKNTTLRFPRANDGRKDAPAFAAVSPGVTVLSVSQSLKKRIEYNPPFPRHSLGLSGMFQDSRDVWLWFSEQEARLVTVITLWAGNDRQKQSRENLRWVQKLLAPYQDRSLRVRTLTAHSAAIAVNGSPMNFEDESTTSQFPSTEVETICVV